MSQFLVGARAIACKLKELGLIKEDDPNGEDKVYHWVKTNRISAGRFGNQFITTPEKLQSDAEKLVP